MSLSNVNTNFPRAQTYKYLGCLTNLCSLRLECGRVNSALSNTLLCLNRYVDYQFNASNPYILYLVVALTR